ncbi:SAM-dependent methyltransferase [Hyphomicrobium methylovorum]|uniref:class I SAM-dependent methyltransferase n=1 Tax=Hyphomicrobium methylovorum TaxID=84 RepID=UPI0015E66A9A|nr:class I SAM-dependent methyltransferase [Hyphomicrobium methylovorum]MBA2126028.1 SAM-dependent methyltransferase [Hyphomicrobium methylovorum]
MPGAPQIFDRPLLRQRRDRIANGEPKPGCEFLLSRVAEDFVERLGIIRRDFPLTVNLGAYDGLLSRELRRLPNLHRIIDVEYSSALAARDVGERVVADEEALPFAPQSLDLVVSGLALHLVNDLPGALVQINRALRPDGLFLAALLGGTTLTELREAWLLAEEEVLGGASPRVAPCADVRDLGALLQRAGFALPVADSDVVDVTYASPFALMQDVKAMAASNMLIERSRRPVTRSLLLRAAEIYAEKFPAPGGRVRATFEIITLTGWVPHESQQKPLAPGSATTRLADVLKPSSKDPEAKE